MPTIAAIWRGQIPLSKVVWFYGFMGSIVLALPVNLSTITGAPRSNTLMVSYCVLVVLYTVFVSVAIWKSANQYRGLFIWPLISKLSVAIVLSLMAASFLVGLLR